MKVDLLKLSRLNRVAVCGRCKHHFTISVSLGNREDEEEQDGLAVAVKATAPPRSSGFPAPSEPPRSIEPVQKSVPPRSIEPVQKSVPPFPSGPPRKSEPPPSEPRHAVASAHDSEPPPASKPGGTWPRSTPPPATGSEPQRSWPAPPPSFKKRTSAFGRKLVDDDEIEVAPVSHPRGKWPNLELELDMPSSSKRPRRDEPDEEHWEEPAEPRPHIRAPAPEAPADEEEPPAKKPGIFRRRKQIVVEVGSKGSQGRNRRTYKPENVMTQPGGTIASELRRKK